MSCAMVCSNKCSNKVTNEWSLGGLHVASNNEVLNRGSVGTWAIHSQPAQYFRHTSFELQPFNSFVGPIPATKKKTLKICILITLIQAQGLLTMTHLLWLILVLTMLQPLLFSYPTCANLTICSTSLLECSSCSSFQLCTLNFCHNHYWLYLTTVYSSS